MLVPKVNVVLQADKDIGSITEADIWLNCMDGNGNFLSVAAEDHTGDGHYIATLPLDYSPVEPFIQVHLNEMVYDYLSIPNFKAGQECQISLILGTDGLRTPGIGAEIDDWEVVEGDVLLSLAGVSLFIPHSGIPAFTECSACSARLFPISM